MFYCPEIYSYTSKQNVHSFIIMIIIITNNIIIFIIITIIFTIIIVQVPSLSSFTSNIWDF